MKATLAALIISVLFHAGEPNVDPARISGDSLKTLAGSSPRPMAVSGETSQSVHAAGGFWKFTETFHVKISARVARAASTGLYVYSYEVMNADSSLGVVETFGLYPIPKPDSVHSPEHWSAYYGYAEEDEGLVWWLKEPGPPPPGWIDTGNNMYPGENGIVPGQAQAGFTFSSPHPPGEVHFTIQIWEPLPSVESEPYGYELPFFSRGATGTVVGPINGN